MNREECKSCFGNAAFAVDGGSAAAGHHQQGNATIQ